MSTDWCWQYSTIYVRFISHRLLSVKRFLGGWNKVSFFLDQKKKINWCETTSNRISMDWISHVIQAKKLNENALYCDVTAQKRQSIERHKFLCLCASGKFAMANLDIVGLVSHAKMHRMFLYFLSLNALIILRQLHWRGKIFIFIFFFLTFLCPFVRAYWLTTSSRVPDYFILRQKWNRWRTWSQQMNWKHFRLYFSDIIWCDPIWSVGFGRHCLLYGWFRLFGSCSINERNAWFFECIHDKIFLLCLSAFILCMSIRSTDLDNWILKRKMGNQM